MRFSHYQEQISALFLPFYTVGQQKIESQAHLYDDLNTLYDTVITQLNEFGAASKFISKEMLSLSNKLYQDLNKLNLYYSSGLFQFEFDRITASIENRDWVARLMERINQICLTVATNKIQVQHLRDATREPMVFQEWVNALYVLKRMSTQYLIYREHLPVTTISLDSSLNQITRFLLTIAPCSLHELAEAVAQQGKSQRYNSILMQANKHALEYLFDNQAYRDVVNGINKTETDKLSHSLFGTDELPLFAKFMCNLSADAPLDSNTGVTTHSTSQNVFHDLKNMGALEDKVIMLKMKEVLFQNVIEQHDMQFLVEAFIHFQEKHLQWRNRHVHSLSEVGIPVLVSEGHSKGRSEGEAKQHTMKFYDVVHFLFMGTSGNDEAKVWEKYVYTKMNGFSSLRFRQKLYETLSHTMSPAMLEKHFDTLLLKMTGFATSKTPKSCVTPEFINELLNNPNNAYLFSEAMRERIGRAYVKHLRKQKASIS